MSKTQNLLPKALILSLVLLFTSCINIFEHVTFNQDGSGSYTFQVDMKKMLDMYASMGMEMDGEELFNEMNLEEPAMVDKLSSIEGVSNVRPIVNKEDVTISLNFDFEDIDALNAGISTYMHDSTDGPEVVLKTFYERNGNTLVRTTENPVLDTFTEEISQEDLNNPMMQAMMGDLSFSQKITLVSGISAFDNEEYQRVDDSTIEWATFIFDPEKFQKNVRVTITQK
jgi:hypothetical protein